MLVLVCVSYTTTKSFFWFACGYSIPEISPVWLGTSFCAFLENEEEKGGGERNDDTTLLQQFREALKYQSSNKSNQNLAAWFNTKIVKTKRKLDWKKPLKDRWAKVVKALDDPKKVDELRSFSEKEQRAVVALYSGGKAATQPSTPQAGGDAQPGCCIQ